MSSSDVRAFEALRERVAQLDVKLTMLAEVVLARAKEIVGLEAKVATLSEAVLGKDVSGEVYGEPADHAADRAERGRLLRRPGRERLVPAEPEKASDHVTPEPLQGPARGELQGDEVA